MIKRAIALLILPFAGPALAEGFLLDLPVDCDLASNDCYIQQYMDLDPTTGVTDYHCQGLSYEGHKGTDFAVPTRRHMAIGVPVVAAAPGIVAGIRDGMPDTGLTAETAETIKGRECGNGVTLRHANGWETQYCHLRQGSVRVTKGETVTAGTELGLIGQSGRAEFPHLHLSVRKDGIKIDPFDPDGTLSCNTPGDSSLWTDPPVYQPGGLLDIGITTRIPDYAEVKAGSAAAKDIPTTTAALVIYGYAFGVRTDDVLHLSLIGPGKTVITKDITFDRNQAQTFRAIGKKRRNTPWPAGTYKGTVSLIRDTETLETRTISQVLR